jgi:hypothetical protein
MPTYYVHFARDENEPQPALTDCYAIDATCPSAAFNEAIQKFPTPKNATLAVVTEVTSADGQKQRVTTCPIKNAAVA